MNIRAKSEKGFSLIELLVVVAIIGVLAAVGVVGYQGYIDSTKKSVTDANAKAVHQWIIEHENRSCRRHSPLSMTCCSELNVA